MISSIQSPKNPLYPPAANRLWVGDSWNNSLQSAPQFVFKLQNVTPGAHHDQVSEEGKDGFAAAYDDPEVVIDLLYDSAPMTKEQWAKWPADADDEEYILNAVAENKGLVRI